ncbi:MraY family glycosyltransferase [Chondrinema litorale]|uniref:MraY family glycosyltransferase n=1 Tax=Chondrinema litorale TaxID=2994555 RepID=UPI002543146A|nr:glycosyltransferase family 4 protein [Chondrinema litorale]UZR95487.1 glycosyltransferase family 4 protein [Chondrinema litorale]
MIFFFLFASLFLIQKIYFVTADKYNIVDKPNERSSHDYLTIRGGGIIFPIAIYIGAIVFQVTIPFFLFGLFLISVISFWDDISSLPSRYRILVHFISIALLMFSVGVFELSYWVILPIFIVATGIINAFNFMDGINGITGGYSLITLLTLLYIDQEIINFINERLILVIIFSVIIFLFFNFRKRARCFAGDIGSVSIAFIIIYLLLTLILKSNNLIYILLLSVYGIDSIFTIVERLLNKENIFKPHRKHLYQLLANEMQISHLKVSSIYIIFQALINAVLVIFLHVKEYNFWLLTFLNLALQSILYLFVKNKIKYIIKNRHVI